MESSISEIRLVVTSSMELKGVTSSSRFLYGERTPLRLTLNCQNSVRRSVLYAEKDRNRTFIVQDYAEDDCGHWAKDEVTGEQGHVDDERSCFWTRDDTERVTQSRLFKGRWLKRKGTKRT